MGRRLIPGVVLAGGAALILSGCAQPVQGSAVSVFADPFRVAGMPATDGPTGLRDDAAEPTRDVTGTDGGEIDHLAASAISDIEEFWEQSYGESFDGEFEPVSELISWDADGFDGVFCESDTYNLVNAAFCHDDRTIGWDRGVLLPSLLRANGDMAVSMVMAHEYGHAIQEQAGLVSRSTPTLAAEQQADCLAGVYMRWVAEGSSPRFTLSTGDGLNNLMGAMIAFRDPLLSVDDSEAGEDEHGSAFERVSAFQFGFTDGAASCAAMDPAEIKQRRGDLPVLLPEDQSGELQITADSVRSVVDAMNILFEPADPPELTFDQPDCPDADSDAPAAFCPATNTIAVDLPALELLGAQSDDEDAGLATGDNTAYSVLVSRYMQSIQHQHGGVELDTAQAALRTACLTGVATAKLVDEVNTPDGNTIALTAGDVDEAVSGILLNGLVASDVNGESVPSGFSRIDAFRVGVLGESDRCFKRFP
ncbi:neutral zinc metallopeptidase [Mycolicibacterium bacteremicum]|uniref:Peptidase n=1 Tax=Mycolicibacterium bacteremicum TaxID=564198 RepID=A0A1W9YYL8_MYCBA|nr:neutral zinc metallopeptidase [Mycolicibacterium bacteremicum]MCV7431244.1 neutral zinc metallopeptidase [Mycolicibacterium bacteremicum]ORA05022.1 peptidase [Mycolicibacterium bacteremicum]